MMEMGGRFFIFSAKVHNAVLEERNHTVIDVGPLFTRIEKNDSHRGRVLEDANPFRGIQRGSCDLFFRLDAEDPFPHVQVRDPTWRGPLHQSPFLEHFDLCDGRDRDVKTE